VLAARDAFGEKVLPVYLLEQNRLVGLITGDHSHDDQRGALIEGVIEESEDETLMERYVGGEEVDAKLLVEDLERAVARGSFHPVVPVDSSTGLGARELLDLVVAGFPAPAEHPMPEVFTPAGKAGPALTCDPDGPLVAEVVKTTSDAYVGRVSLVRVFSGTVRPDATVHVSGHFSEFYGAEQGHGDVHPDHDEDERIGALSIPLGKAQRPVELVVAGDICAIGRLSRAETGDTLSDKDTPLVLKPWSMPEPLLPLAIQARAKADEDKLGQGLQRLTAEDPTVRIEHDAETRQIVLWTVGEAHADVLLDRLEHRHGVGVDQVPLRVALRETFASGAQGHGRHVKQSGGHGQFAVCDIEVEPLPGGGFEFVDKVVGGAVPRQFIPSVEKGVRAQMERGLVAGYPVVDIRVTLTDGKAHSVDSSDMAFQTAGALALREAAAAARTCLLEPVDDISVLVPDDLVGAVMSDLSGRRGRVTGTEPAGDERTLVRAEVPQIEISRYAVDLRAFSHGAASFTRTFARYEPMPENVAAKVTAAG
jgi:elongation factor G